MNQKKAEITRELKRALIILALAGVLFGFDKALYANGASQQLQFCSYPVREFRRHCQNIRIYGHVH